MSGFEPALSIIIDVNPSIAPYRDLLRPLRKRYA